MRESLENEENLSEDVNERDVAEPALYRLMMIFFTLVTIVAFIAGVVWLGTLPA